MHIQSRCFSVFLVLTTWAILVGVSFGQTVTYTYDDLNRLTKVDYGNGSYIEYSYDEVGNRIARISQSSAGGLATPIKDGFESGDSSGLDWEFAGDADWSVVLEAYSGRHSTQAGSIDDDESSAMEIMLDCIDGEISFYCRISSESDADYLRFYIDGSKNGQWSGQQGWTQASYPVAAGIRTFKWEYAKNGEVKDLGLINPDIDGGTGSRIGSLAGRLQNGTIQRCYVDGGRISGDSRVGGLVGQISSGGIISACSSNTSVTGTEESIGGLVGINFNEIKGSRAAGPVRADYNVGGLIGYAAAKGAVSSSFWDIQATGQASSAEGEGKTTTRMQRSSTFVSTGWDFTTPIWTIAEGVDYPHLWWEP